MIATVTSKELHELRALAKMCQTPTVEVKQIQYLARVASDVAEKLATQHVLSHGDIDWVEGQASGARAKGGVYVIDGAKDEDASAVKRVGEIIAKRFEDAASYYHGQAKKGFENQKHVFGMALAFTDAAIFVRRCTGAKLSEEISKPPSFMSAMDAALTKSLLDHPKEGDSA